MSDKMNNISGEYVFENFTLINPLNRDIDDYYLTIMHEYAHMLLSLQSNVGIMQYCLNRLPLQKLHSDTRKILSHFLCKHSIKVQEAIAVFTECFVKLIDDGDDGKEALKQYIYKLKCTNGTYYKYLEKLLPILKIMREEKSSENIKKAYSAVFQCAVYALSLIHI